MTVSKLKKENGVFLCPECHQGLECLTGGQVRVVNGKADYDNVKDKHVCRSCGSFYRELLHTGYYDVFALTPEVLSALDEQQAAVRNGKKKDAFPRRQAADPVVPLAANAQGEYPCPRCGSPMIFSEGGAVRVIDGRVDYENVKPRYVCRGCRIFYRELLSSGLYEVFELQEDSTAPVRPLPPKRRIKAVGDLPPTQLKLDADGHCACPRCGAVMRFLEPDAVKIVDGRADMSDTVARFKCDECDSLYRQIASTSYFQWCEK